MLDEPREDKHSAIDLRAAPCDVTRRWRPASSDRTITLCARAVIRCGGSFSRSSSHTEQSDATMQNLGSFSALLHKEHPSLFPEPESALRSILNIGHTIEERDDNSLDSLCTHTLYNACWLLRHEDALNEILVLHNLEIVELHCNTYTLRHLGHGTTSEGSPNTPLDAGREALVKWLLRVHRCIRNLSLDLTAITESPTEFCDALRLHRNYRSIHIGVSGRESPRCQQLTNLLCDTTGLLELSLFGIHMFNEEDGVRIHSVVVSNDRIRKLSFQRCHDHHSNLKQIVHAATRLPDLEELVLSVEKPGSSSSEDLKLESLLGHPCYLRKLRLHIDTSYREFLEYLAINQCITELEITHKVSEAWDLIPLLGNTGLENALRRLVISLDMQSVLKDESYEVLLLSFLEEAALDMLKFHNTLFTEKGIRAIANGLKMNGKFVCKATSDPAMKDSEKRPFLKELHLRGENLSCDELSILVESLQYNRFLKVLDVGAISATERSTHWAVTKTIVDNLTATLPERSARSEKSPTAPFRVVKDHFPEELMHLISALCSDITFQKLNFVFLLNPDEDRNTRIMEFGHLLALLPYCTTLNTLETVSIESNSCGIPDEGAVGLAMLACMSKTLVDLTLSLGDCSSEITSILLFEGLADNVSIRQLTMSGWGLASPAPLFFQHMCQANKSLQRLHIHMTNVADKGNAAFIDQLPNALKYISSLLEFRVTHGTEREEVFLDKVPAVLRRNQKLLSDAAKLVADLVQQREFPQGSGEVGYDVHLTRPRSRTFNRVKDLPELRKWIMIMTGWSTEKIEAELAFTKELAAGLLSEAGEAGTSDDVDEETQSVFEDLRLSEVAQPPFSEPYDGRYGERLRALNSTARAVYYGEENRYSKLCKDLQEALRNQDPDLLA
ncbi:hypothetical protein V5799_028443 [Amblyomma americanum]|uniref:Uncharacterized protein n=1 Tax=Amblyomma americanum TaxID=6943 RepID=A0AAQ4DCV0_AMBAM